MNTSEAFFSPSTVVACNKFQNNILNLESVSAFKNKVLKVFIPISDSTFNVHNPHEITVLIRLQVGLNEFREHKFRYSFQDSLDPFLQLRSRLNELFTSFSFSN